MEEQFIFKQTILGYRKAQFLFVQSMIPDKREDFVMEQTLQQGFVNGTFNMIQRIEQPEVENVNSAKTRFRLI